MTGMPNSAAGCGGRGFNPTDRSAGQHILNDVKCNQMLWGIYGTVCSNR